MNSAIKNASYVDKSSRSPTTTSTRTTMCKDETTDGMGRREPLQCADPRHILQAYDTSTCSPPSTTRSTTHGANGDEHNKFIIDFVIDMFDTPRASRTALYTTPTMTTPSPWHTQIPLNSRTERTNRQSSERRPSARAAHCPIRDPSLIVGLLDGNTHHLLRSGVTPAWTRLANNLSNNSGSKAELGHSHSNQF